MNFEKINNLLIKYFNGDTSLEEEKLLRGYFSSKNIDERLVKYQPLFTFLRTEKEVKASDLLVEMISALMMPRRMKPRPFMEVIKEKQGWRMAATVALLMITSWAISKHLEVKNTSQMTVNQPHTRKAKIIVLDENTDPQLALIEVEKALMLVSKNMKKGTDETTESLQKVRTATKVFRN